MTQLCLVRLQQKSTGGGGWWFGKGFPFLMKETIVLNFAPFLNSSCLDLIMGHGGGFSFEEKDLHVSPGITELLNKSLLPLEFLLSFYCLRKLII